MTEAAHCEACGARIVLRAVGRPRRYCNGACRRRAHRTRQFARWLADIEKMRAQLRDDAAIDWSDEDHRIA